VLKEFIGINDAINCFGGDLWACGSLIIGAIPWGKVAKIPSVVRAVNRTIAAIQAWRAAKRAAEAVLAAARAAERAALNAKKLAIERAKRAAQAAKKKAADAANTTSNKAVNTTKKTGNPTQREAQANANPKGSSARSGGHGSGRSNSGGSKPGGTTGGSSRNNAGTTGSSGAGKTNDGAGNTGDSCPLRNSFTPGTPVLMADGSTKPIEDVKPGDKVVATDPETGETEVETVTAVIKGDGVKHLVKVVIDTDGPHGSETAEVTATDGHPFWVPELGEWVDATDLQPGQWLRTSAGTYVQITAVQRWTTSRATVHNLTIANTHTYHVAAGGTPVLVHNCDLAQVAANHRASANGGQGVASRKNIAVMRSEIDGQEPRITIATSGRHVNPGEVGMPSTRRFSPLTPTRAYDSEVFLLEDLAARLDATATGTVHIYSERAVCDSCSNVIDQFRRMFPNIRVVVSTGQD
jgi:hypothetical protein